MALSAENWKNKKGTSERKCKCGSWGQHWVNYSQQDWPTVCSVRDCAKEATLGGHIISETEQGEWIAPICDSCNKRDDVFDLRGGITLVPANKNETCEN